MAFLKCKEKLPKPYGVLSQSISLLILAENQLAVSKAAHEKVKLVVEMALKAVYECDKRGTYCRSSANSRAELGNIRNMPWAKDLIIDNL